ncbi:PAS domain S-box protein, partial [Paucibacter sp. O1-1]|nr:PAS domain S-box protein [Paucibacter sp. O1-1]MDA3831330.1 PAS domain S-box protein [Paucibacter sp. O1-1]
MTLSPVAGGGLIGIALPTSATAPDGSRPIPTGHALATELLAMERLHAITTRLSGGTDLEAILGDILDAVLDLHGTQSGALQLLDSVRGSLQLAVQRGLSESFVAQLDGVPVVESTLSGRAICTGQRAVLQENEALLPFEVAAPVAELADIRSAQCTPILTHGGRMLGVLTTYCTDEHCFGEQELRLTDLYAHQAAELIERNQAQAELRASQDLAAPGAGCQPRRQLALRPAYRRGEWDYRMREIWGCTITAAGANMREALGRIHPQDRESVHRAVQDALDPAGDGAYSIDYRICLPDGSQRWISANGRASFEGEGQDRHAVLLNGTALDITDQKRVEGVLERLMQDSERSRRLYETILSNTPDLVYVFDLKHCFIYANDALLQLWGKSWDEAAGKTFLELGYPEWHAAMHDREIDLVIRTRQPVRGEVPFTGTQGLRIYDYIFTPVLGNEGEVEAIAGTTRDVTERKQAEESIRTQAERQRLLWVAAASLLTNDDPELMMRELFARIAPHFSLDT